jgi:glycosyltransferase involved in cell wall biosynthesis
MPRFYHTIDALIFPSSFEVFGLTPLEAQAAGVPVIAAAIPAVREVLSPENALLLPPEDIPGMAAAIQRLASDPEFCRQLAAGGLQNARRYTLEAYLPRLEKIYRSLVN